MQNIGAVILAAGGSTRFGRPKQLLQFRGQSFLERIVDLATEAGCNPVIVVVGAERTLSMKSASAVLNERWREGMGTSIRAGVQHLVENFPEASAVVLLVCDQPFVGTDTIRQLIDEHVRTKSAIIASSYAETVGVPALFNRECFSELLALEGEHGAKKIMLAHRDHLVEIPFLAGKIDIDTPEDYERLTSDD